jgi:methanogenic corrinoid protein MtbC1
LADRTWDRVFATAVLPRLRLRPGGERNRRVAGRPPDQPSSALWHAHREAAAELAGVLQALDPSATVRYVDALLDQGAHLEPLFREVFEPAARCLGRLWEDDGCDDFQVTLALSRLQLEVHRLSLVLVRHEYVAHPGHAILIAPQPGEVHGLGASMAAELFWRGGWDVRREVRADDHELRRILHQQWFDVLDLSLSTALRRDQQLPAMRLTIRAARAASLNPALAVMVDGRYFFECPQAYRDVGADIGCAPADAVSAAHHHMAIHEFAHLADAGPQNLSQGD